MTIRGTALLVGLLLVLLGAVWMTTPGPDTSARQDGLLGTEFRDDVSRLEWEEADRRVVLQRDGDRWVDDHGRPLAGGEVDDVFEALGTVHPLTTIDMAPSDAGGYGLDRPRRLRLLDAERRVLLDVDVGRRNPAATGLYVRLNGHEEVLLVGALLDWELAKLSRAVAAGGKP